MNRRGFLLDMLKAGVAAAMLPSALTYGRTWKRTKELWVINPAWVNAEYESHILLNPKDYMGKWQFIDLPLRWKEYLCQPKQ